MTSRSDIRLLMPGFRYTSVDLLTVAGKYVRPGATVWDIGSNLGIFSFASAWKTGPSGEVFTLEADPDYISLQHRTIQGLPAGYGRVHPLCAAAAHTMSILELANPKRGHARSHLTMVGGNDPGESEYGKQTVSVTCDFLLEHWGRPDVVKIDIEGAEALFLSGAEQLLRAVRPILYVEVGLANVATVTEMLTAHHYQLFRLDERGTEQRTDRCEFNTVAKPA